MLENRRKARNRKKTKKKTKKRERIGGETRDNEKRNK